MGTDQSQTTQFGYGRGGWCGAKECPSRPSAENLFSLILLCIVVLDNSSYSVFNTEFIVFVLFATVLKIN